MGGFRGMCGIVGNNMGDLQLTSFIGDSLIKMLNMAS